MTSINKFNRRLAIAPMMACTDRHYRYFMRLLTKNTFLYTEMVHSRAVLHGNVQRLLDFSPEEHPIALQVGGCESSELAQCARIAAEWQYDEINLNVGCPSERVQSGQFGACLFKQPECVAEAVALMKAAAPIPVTVKTRIGVDDHDSYAHLQHFITAIAAAGCQTVIIHARKAWLQGLNPKQNREVPPLNYSLVYQLKRDFPQLEIIINGGVKSIKNVQQHLQQVDGVMLGREAYSNPYLFADVDQQFYADNAQVNSRHTILTRYLPYVAQQLLQGVRLRQLLRPVIGLFQGQPGARQWRRYLSDHAGNNNIDVLEQAMNFIQ